MTKGYGPSSKPSSVKQDSKEQFKITGYQFSAEIEFIEVSDSNGCRSVC